MDEIMMDNSLGRATLDAHEKDRIARVVDEMKGAGAYATYFAH